MANNLENYGLEFFAEEEETFLGLLSRVVQEGKAVLGYSGAPLFFKPMGQTEFWASAELDAQKGELNVKSLHTHCCGQHVWEAAVTDIDLTPPDAPKTEKILMVSPLNGRGGILPVDLINADVLPSFLRGEAIRFQVVAQPLRVEYYADEEAYDEAQPADEDGKKFLIADGSMFPLSFLYNHDPSRYEDGKHYESDAYVHFRATVKALYHGTFRPGEKSFNTFIRCVADTEYGELEFHHTYEQVPEELRDNIKVGAVVTGVCILSCDAAIDEYENGFLRDREHDLRLLGHVFSKGGAERLRCVLDRDAVYDSEASGKRVVGADEIVGRLDHVHENNSDGCFPSFAEVTETPDPAVPAGTRCILLAYGEEEAFEAVAFADVDENGFITAISIRKLDGFSFRRDEPVGVKTPFDDFRLPDNVFEPIIARAKFHGYLDWAQEEDAILGEIPDRSLLEDNVQRMLDALEEDPQPDAEAALANVVGYLFAKAIEDTLNRRRRESPSGMTLTSSYFPAEAIRGTLSSSLNEKEHKKLERAMEKGKQFFKDVSFFAQTNDVREEAFVSLFREAAVVVQHIGRLAAKGFEDN